jgi:ATP-dependent DNA helicase RecG
MNTNASQMTGATLDNLMLKYVFQKTYLEPLISAGWIERTILDKPTSPNQRYRLTEKGRAWLEKIKSG